MRRLLLPTFVHVNYKNKKYDLFSVASLMERLVAWTNKTLIVVCSCVNLANTVFAISLVPDKLGFVNPFWAMCIYSWYWWIYAINVVVYVVTSKDFCSVYSIFLRDLTYPVRTFTIGCFSKKH